MLEQATPAPFAGQRELLQPAPPNRASQSHLSVSTLQVPWLWQLPTQPWVTTVAQVGPENPGEQAHLPSAVHLPCPLQKSLSPQGSSLEA